MNVELERLASQLSSRGQARSSDLAALIDFVGEPLPDDYLAFVAAHDGAEGWVGDAYVALWTAAEIPEFNTIISSNLFMPGCVLIGSDGGGEGLGFDTRTSRMKVVTVPLVGLAWERASELAPSFTDWITRMAGSGKSEIGGVPRWLGKSIYEVQPILFGGSPTEESNKALVSIREHLGMARWWNARLGELRDADQGDK
jgi:SMI1 / KNR4 family (SUKH-1)